MTEVEILQKKVRDLEKHIYALQREITALYDIIKKTEQAVFPNE